MIAPAQALMAAALFLARSPHYQRPLRAGIFAGGALFISAVDQPALMAKDPTGVVRGSHPVAALVAPASVKAWRRPGACVLGWEQLVLLDQPHVYT
jgi:hypothetical protein